MRVRGVGKEGKKKVKKLPCGVKAGVGCQYGLEYNMVQREENKATHSEGVGLCEREGKAWWK